MASEGSQRRLIVPPMLEGGVYANEFFAWHSFHEFTLDFAVGWPAWPSELDEPEGSGERASQVVGRIRLPVTMAFEVIRRLNVEMTDYERRFGEIRRGSDDGGEQ